MRRTLSVNAGQRVDRLADEVMLPTTSRAWNYFEAIQSRLSSRLAGFRRTKKVGDRRRPSKQENNAALFEADLRYIFSIAPDITQLSKADYEYMDATVAELLEVLDDLVNDELFETEDEQVPQGWERETTELPEPYDAAVLRDKYPRLRALTNLLDNAEGTLNLATGQGSVFTQPPDGDWSLALKRVSAWKTFLNKSAATSTRPHDAQLFSMRQAQLPLELKEARPGVLDKRASVLVGAMFQRLNCGNGLSHEIKLKVTEDLYTGPLQPVLDMLVSSCQEGTEWHEAEGATFTFEDVHDVEETVCSAIDRARCEGRKIHISFNRERRLCVVLGRALLAHPYASTLRSDSLSELLHQKLFYNPSLKDLLEGTPTARFGSRHKAVLALSLARCLMDFIDEGLELALHSWNPEHIFLQYPEGADASKGVLFISLKKSHEAEASDLIGSIGPGNPVLLAFARLLLEIYGGDKLAVEIHQSDVSINLHAWAKLCKLLFTANNMGDDHFLEAVKGCLYLHNDLGNGRGAADPDAAHIVRHVIYEKIVRNLEVMANPAGTKRNRRGLDNVAEHRPPKRFQPGGRHTAKPRGKMEGILSKKRPLASSTLVVMKQEVTEDLVRSLQTITLYDEEVSGDSQESKLAVEYLKRLDAVKQYFILPLRNLSAPMEDKIFQRPVRIAIIDSGVDMSDPCVKGAGKRIKAKRNWTDDNPENWTDTYGHGTHVARLIIRVAPAAEIYIARVSTTKKIAPEETERIAEAIKWASTNWDVDIISLSLGLDKEHPEIDTELHRVLSPDTREGRKRIVIAAAANWAGNNDIAYPARRQRVICINATDGGGNPSKMNPTRTEGMNFALLGLSIQSRKKKEEPPTSLADGGMGEGAAAAASAGNLIKPKSEREDVLISGTSYATPIAAGIAANILEFARHRMEMTPGESEMLYSWSGMSRVFTGMSVERQFYDYIMPWTIFDAEHDTKTISGCLKKILNGDDPREVVKRMKEMSACCKR